jgi:hypothetical protein
MERALDLIRETPQSMTSIALSLGCGDPCQFHARVPAVDRLASQLLSALNAPNQLRAQRSMSLRLRKLPRVRSWHLADIQPVELHVRS